jgi:hypothetical protein
LQLGSLVTTGGNTGFLLVLGQVRGIERLFNVLLYLLRWSGRRVGSLLRWSGRWFGSILMRQPGSFLWCAWRDWANRCSAFHDPPPARRGAASRGAGSRAFQSVVECWARGVYLQAEWPALLECLRLFLP